VTLDFGANSFPGSSRFLEVSARTIGAGSFTLLTPRQQVTSTPYAVRSASSANADNATNAATATNATQLGGIAASQYVQTNDSRLADARLPTAGSPNYVQNTNSQQPATNFNVSGNGTIGGTLTGNIVNSSTQFNIGGFVCSQTEYRYEHLAGSAPAEPNPFPIAPSRPAGNSFLEIKPARQLPRASNSFFGLVLGLRT
jgi:hypothetical protein